MFPFCELLLAQCWHNFKKIVVKTFL
jgi:hypothetical protein